MNKQQQKGRPLRVGLISLGCAKNLVDAEVMIGVLRQNGLEITNADASADVVVINTCSFIEAAQQESVDTILECAAERDRRNPGQSLVVAGCLPQRFRQQLPGLLPEVDLFIGVDQLERVGELIRETVARRTAQRQTAREPGRRSSVEVAKRMAEIAQNTPGVPLAGDSEKAQPGPGALLAGNAPASAGTAGLKAVPGPEPRLVVTPRPRYILDASTPRYRLTPPHTAYVKIAEGCNHPCSFCSIPIIRGRYRSRRPEDIVEEARRCVAEGVKELNLISQDTTYYGRDLGAQPARLHTGRAGGEGAGRLGWEQQTDLARLLKELDALDGDFWVRILYTHPAHWTDELMEAMAGCSKVAKYVDIPLQHIHPVMLERMRRETTRETLLELVQKLRKRIPGVTLRTTFIVGFPGETEARFEALLAFVQEARFERLGVFTYSREEGTRAARMEGQIPDKEKRRRRERLMAVQRKISRDHCARKVGQFLKVLVEGRAGENQLKEAEIYSWEHGWLRGRNDALFPGQGAYSVGRSEGDAPEIDGRVFIKGSLPPGKFAMVRIIGHTDYDLVGVPAEDSGPPVSRKLP